MMLSIRCALALLAVIHFSGLAAQSPESAEALMKERFTVSFEVGPRSRLQDVVFEATTGQRYDAKILNAAALGDVLSVNGAKVSGSFALNELSGTDLGSGRVYSGAGRLTFNKVMKPDGEAVGCPPLCERSVRLRVELQPSR